METRLRRLRGLRQYRGVCRRHGVYVGLQPVQSAPLECTDLCCHSSLNYAGNEVVSEV